MILLRGCHIVQRKIRISLFSVLTLLFVVIIYWVYEIRKGSTPFLDKWSGEYVEHFAGTFVYDMFWSVTHLGSKFFLIPFTTIVSVILWVLFRDWLVPDRKSTRLNSSHVAISYAVFCLKKKIKSI